MLALLKDPMRDMQDGDDAPEKDKSILTCAGEVTDRGLHLGISLNPTMQLWFQRRFLNSETIEGSEVVWSTSFMLSSPARKGFVLP